MDPSSVLQQQQQQQQQKEQLMDEFRAGLTACLRSWSALRTAVESGWGNTTDPLAAAEDLRSNILEHLDGSCFPPHRLTVDDLEDNLAIYLEEEFSVTLEDGSDRQIAQVIWSMYENCHLGDPTLARQVRQAAEQAVAQSASYPVKIQSTEHDDDDDDDDDDQMDEGNAAAASAVPQLTTVASPPLMMMSAREYASQYLFGEPKRNKAFVPTGPVRQLGEVVEETNNNTGPMVDDDGFATVPTKGRRRAR